MKGGLCNGVWRSVNSRSSVFPQSSNLLSVVKSKTSCELMQGVHLESNIKANEVFKARQQLKLFHKSALSKYTSNTTTTGPRTWGGEGTEETDFEFWRAVQLKIHGEVPWGLEQRVWCKCSWIHQGTVSSGADALKGFPTSPWVSVGAETL